LLHLSNCNIDDTDFELELPDSLVLQNDMDLCFNVSIVDDATFEEDEVFTLNLVSLDQEPEFQFNFIPSTVTILASDGKHYNSNYMLHTCILRYVPST